MPLRAAAAYSPEPGRKPLSTLTVCEGSDGAAIAAGNVYIAPGDFHMEVRRGREGEKLILHQGPRVNSCRPAVDVLFQSAATVYGSGCIAAVLTGMGRDGVAGCQDIIASGGCAMVQDERSSVVWGMPGAVVLAGLPTEILPIHDARLQQQIVEALTTHETSFFRDTHLFQRRLVTVCRNS